MTVKDSVNIKMWMSEVMNNTDDIAAQDNMHLREGGRKKGRKGGREEGREEER